MNTKINCLLELTIDIEALLMFASKRGNDTPEYVWEKIKNNVNTLNLILNETAIAHEDNDVVADNIDIIDEEDILINTQEETIVSEAINSDDAICEDNENICNRNYLEHEEKQSDIEILRVEELLQRQTSKDLRKAFTLNDKFRFTRELFANNELVFSETIEVISKMASSADALSYLYSELQWDKNNEEVKNFVSIIINHFNSKQ